MTMRPAACAIFSLLLTVFSSSFSLAADGQVEVVVINLRNANGHVRVGLCPQETFLETDCPYEAEAAAIKGETIVTVRGVPPGTYAAQVFHDENNNHEVDRSWLGIPEEGVGFSNDPSFTFGPPSFSDASFRLGADGGRITVRLRYFD
jgi:uncharacterized protein (DUF2141 family)